MNPEMNPEVKEIRKRRWRKVALAALIVMLILAVALVFAYHSMVKKPELPPVVVPVS